MGTSKNLVLATSSLRADPSGTAAYYCRTSLLLSRILRSSILSSSRLVRLQNEAMCHQFEVLRGTLISIPNGP